MVSALGEHSGGRVTGLSWDECHRRLSGIIRSNVRAEMKTGLGLVDKKRVREVLLARGVAGSRPIKGERIVYLGSCSGPEGKILEVEVCRSWHRE